MNKTTSKATSDAIELLIQDHKKTRKSFKEFQELGPQAYKSKKTLVDEICNDLERHTRIEEEIFYPAFRKAVKQSKGLVNEARVEHDTAKELISQLRKMEADEELFDAKVTVLCEYVNHHIEEEENEMFPLAREANLDLEALARQLEERKQELG